MEYNGFEYKINKENEGGYYWWIVRKSDSWLLAEDYNMSLKTKKEAIEECKITIDDYYDNPDDYED